MRLVYSVTGCSKIYMFIMVGNFQLCLMGEIIFAIINLVLGVVVLCIFCSDSNKKP